jgi:hypothetical protein
VQKIFHIFFFCFLWIHIFSYSHSPLSVSFSLMKVSVQCKWSSTKGWNKEN